MRSSVPAAPPRLRYSTARGGTILRFHRLLGFVFATLVVMNLCAIAPAQVAVGVVVSFGPPALPVYVQPPCPAEGYLWVPGYWAWDPDFDDYFWVPGTWVLPPTVGFLWTPGYWAWNSRGFVFTDGYWGPVVGFYGGINYGFGYFGEGYVGGRWDHDRFYYNQTVNNVNVTTVHNVYNHTVVNNYTTVNRVSYNGGQGGTTARPTAQQESAARERRDPVAAQVQQVQAARGNQQLRASVNQGKPPIAATDKPGSFRGANVVAAQQAGAPYHPPAEHGANQPNPNAPRTANQPNPNAARTENTPNPPAHAKDVQPHTMPAPDTGNAKQHQKEQQKLEAQQQKDHQQLEQQQAKEHQQATKQQASEAQMQQMEQRHQQQTQQMEARHNQQIQQMQQREAPSVAHNPPRPQQPPPK